MEPIGCKLSCDISIINCRHACERVSRVSKETETLADVSVRAIENQECRQQGSSEDSLA